MNKKEKNTKKTFIPQSIGESLKKVNKKISYKFGKIDYLIHAKWKEIVGPFFANHSEPIKISSVHNYIDNKEESVFSNYLHVNVSPGIALEFQHFKDKIIEKINSYFGYKAIEGLRTQQNFSPKLDTTSNKKKETKKNIKKLDAELEHETNKIKNKKLEESVVKLGLSIRNEEK